MKKKIFILFIILICWNVNLYSINWLGYPYHAFSMSDGYYSINIYIDAAAQYPNDSQYVDREKRFYRTSPGQSLKMTISKEENLLDTLEYRLTLYWNNSAIMAGAASGDYFTWTPFYNLTGEFTFSVEQRLTTWEWIIFPTVHEWAYYGSKSVKIYLDNTPPALAATPYLITNSEPAKALYSYAIPGLTWVNNNITVKASYPQEPVDQCGLKLVEHKLGDASWTAGDTQALAGQGAYIVSFRACDNLDNYSVASSYCCVIDKEPPADVSGVTVKLTMNAGKIRVNTSWAGTSDYPAGIASGTRGYYYDYRDTDTAFLPYATDRFIPAASALTFGYNLDEQERNKEQKIGITSEDYVGNKKPDYKELKRFHLPQAVQITGTSITNLEMTNNTPARELKVYLEHNYQPDGNKASWETYLDRVAGICLKQNDLTLTDSTADSIKADLAGSREHWTIEGESLVYRTVLTTEIAPHTLYSHSVYTRHKIDPSFQELGNTTPARRLANWPASFTVVIKDGDGNVLQRINQAGYKAGTGNEIVLLKTNSPLYLSLETANAPGTDAEGDYLHYRLLPVSGSVSFPEAFTDMSGHNIPLSFGESRFLHCYVTAEEYRLSGSSPDPVREYLSGLEPGYAVLYKTLHKDSQYADEGFYIGYDLDAPSAACSFEITRADGSSLLNGRINSTSVRLSGITVSDNPAGVDSGIDCIRLYNGTEEPGTWEETALTGNNPLVLSAAVLESITAAEGRTGVRIAVDSAGGSSVLPDILWQIPTGDGSSTVNMVVKDKAGNTRLVTRSVVLDTASSAAPAGLEHSPVVFTEDQGIYTLQMTWQPSASPDVVGYAYKFTCGGVEETGTTTQPAAAFVVDVNALGYNEEIGFEVRAYDYAGNESDPAFYTACTKAGPGEFTAIRTLYDSEYRHYVEWDYASQPGAAADCNLEVFDAGGTERQAVLEIQNGKFTFKKEDPENPGLLRRGTYGYRPVAYNQRGDRTLAEMQYYTLANLAPTQPGILSPKGFSRSETQFLYQAAVDYDGDSLEYTIYWGSGSNPYTFYPLPQNPPAVGYFMHNEVYTWYVKAADGFGGTSLSAWQSFTADDEAPVVGFVNQPGAVSNAEFITVKAVDGLSGISRDAGGKKVVHWWTESGAGTSDRTAVNLDAADMAQIPLAEGSYTLYVEAVDTAGNSTVISISLEIDHTAPRLTSIMPDLAQEGNGYLLPVRMLTAQVGLEDLSATAPGVKKLVYAFVRETGAALQGDTFLAINDSIHTSISRQLSFPVTVPDGAEYYLALAAEDFAGNRSAPVTYVGPIYLDATAPQASVDLYGLVKSGAGEYLARESDLTVDAVCYDSDNVADPLQITYSFVQDGMDEGSFVWNEQPAVPELTAGISYRVAVQAANRAGLSTVAYSREFVFDDTAPVIEEFELVAASGSGYVKSETVVFRGAAVDNESPVVKYELGLGSSPGTTDLSAAIPGSNGGGWLESRNGLFVFGLPEAMNGDYTLTLRATNAAGHTVIRHGEDDNIRLTVDNGQDKVVVQDEAPYTANTDRLTAHWYYTGAETVEEYAYRITREDGAVIVDWNPVNPAAFPGYDPVHPMITVENLSLENGVTYLFAVQATLAGGESVTGAGAGVTVDATLPSLSDISIPTVCTESSITISYNALDAESGIMSSEVLLEAYDSTGQLYRVSGEWLALDNREGVVESPVNTPFLDPEGNPVADTTGMHIYMTLRITNGAGLSVEQRLPVLLIDNTPPPVPLVIDQGAAIRPDATLTMHYTWSQADGESGEPVYEWKVMQSLSELNTTPWQTGTETREVTLTAAAYQKTHGQVLYFAVKARNAAGLESTGISNGIIVDNEAPYIARLYLKDNEDTDALYINSASGLNLHFAAVDELSAISLYAGTYGTWSDTGEWQQTIGAVHYSSADTPLVLSPDPELEEGIISVFEGTCEDTAGNMATGYTRGVVLDTGAPVIKNVHGWVCNDELYADWEAAVYYAPVAKYEIALVAEGAEPGSDDWIDTGLEQHYTVNAVTAGITDGRYQFLVRAQNKAGTYSRRAYGEWGESPLLVLDHTPPDVTVNVDRKYVSHTIAGSIQAVDELTGITGYEYTLGTWENPHAFTSSWLSTSFTGSHYLFNIDFADLPLEVPDGSVVYIRARAKNGVSQWSNSVVSGSVLVDKTAPVLPVVSIADLPGLAGSGGYTRWNNLVDRIAFHSEDAESGITAYSLAVTEGTDDISPENAAWNTYEVPGALIQILDKEQLAIGNLNLENNRDYYVAIKTRNGAGDWSEYGFCPFHTDTTAPQLAFDQAGTEIVVNSMPYAIGYNIIEEESADVEVIFHLQYPDGHVETQPSIRLAPGAGSYTFDQPADAYGVYSLQAELADTAGNNTALSEVPAQQIRINAPPQISLLPFTTTPGALLQLTAAVYDPDGDVPFTYEWDFYDNGSEVSVLERPQHVYQHNTAESQESVYPVRLTITDNAGKSASAVTTVTVRNTSSGILYRNEYWSGVHTVGGNLVIPAGITLTLAPGTEVILVVNPLAGNQHRITVQGRLVINGGAVFRCSADFIGLWDGIRVENEAVFVNVEMEGAVRGLTLLPAAQVTITGCTFRYNRTGIQLTGNSAGISGCRFEENTNYGVKEDSGSNPVMTDNVFTGNGYDYYDENLTIMNGEEINALVGNSGNGRE